MVAIGRKSEARDQALELGAARAAPPSEGDAAVRDIAGEASEGLADCVIEATGSQEPLDLAGRLVRTRGRLVIAGYHQDGPRQVDMQSWNWRGLDVINAHERDPAIYMDGLREAIALVAEGKLDPSPLITHRLPLRNLNEALALAEKRPAGFVKALVTMP